MRTNTETLTCGVCNHIADRRDLVVIHPLSPLRCKDAGACGRRIKRDKVLAEIQEMSTKKKVHPVDRFSMTGIGVSVAFFAFIIVTGLSYLWFGV